MRDDDTHSERTSTCASGKNSENAESGELHSENVRGLQTIKEECRCVLLDEVPCSFAPILYLLPLSSRMIFLSQNNVPSILYR